MTPRVEVPRSTSGRPPVYRHGIARRGLVLTVLAVPGVVFFLCAGATVPVFVLALILAAFGVAGVARRYRIPPDSRDPLPRHTHERGPDPGVRIWPAARPLWLAHRGVPRRAVRWWPTAVTVRGPGLQAGVAADEYHEFLDFSNRLRTHYSTMSVAGVDLALTQDRPLTVACDGTLHTEGTEVVFEGWIRPQRAEPVGALFQVVSCLFVAGFAIAIAWGATFHSEQPEALGFSTMMGIGLFGGGLWMLALAWIWALQLWFGTEDAIGVLLAQLETALDGKAEITRYAWKGAKEVGRYREPPALRPTPPHWSSKPPSRRSLRSDIAFVWVFQVVLGLIALSCFTIAGIGLFGETLPGVDPATLPPGQAYWTSVHEDGSIGTYVECPSWVSSIGTSVLPSCSETTRVALRLVIGFSVVGGGCVVGMVLLRRRRLRVKRSLSSLGTRSTEEPRLLGASPP